MDSHNACQQVSTLLYSPVSNSSVLLVSEGSSAPSPGGEALLLHQDGHGQELVVMLTMVSFPDGKTNLVPPLQGDLSHSLSFCRKVWLARVSALCFAEHLLVWGISF